MARKRPYPDNILHDLNLDGTTENPLDFRCLTEREQWVVQTYYVENKLTSKEIASELNVTELRLRQIVRRALRRIRKNMSKPVSQRQ